MHACDPQFLALLEQRLALMRELANSLREAQLALGCADIGTFESRTSEQINLCRQLRDVEQKLQAAHDHCSCLVPIISDTSSHHRTGVIGEETRKVQDRLRALNRVHAALLRRSAHSLQILSNLLDTAAVAYSATAVVPAGRAGK
jgi:hypothetical protein